MSGTRAASKYTDADNIAARMALLNRGVRMRTLLGTFGPFNAGTTQSFKLRNLGIMTHLDVRVTATQAASATLTASSLAPWKDGSPPTWCRRCASSGS